MSDMEYIVIKKKLWSKYDWIDAAFMHLNITIQLFKLIVKKNTLNLAIRDKI